MVYRPRIAGDDAAPFPATWLINVGASPLVLRIDMLQSCIEFEGW